MATQKETMWTVVQHSGYGYGQDMTFRTGLEARVVRGKEIDAVIKAGGVLFPSYAAADEYAMAEQYPGDTFYLTPRAPGDFSADTLIDGLRVYVPLSEVKA